MFLRTQLSIIFATLVSVGAQTIPVWGQCGGQGWTGSGTCAAGSVCIYTNNWYSQCQPGTQQPSQPPTVTTTSAPPNPTTGTPAPNVPAGVLTQMTNFGSNPTNIGMYVYKPNGVVSNPALVVALHYCTGTAQAFFSNTQYRSLADSKKSYIVLYGNAPASGGCWDVSSTATFTHNGGGDSLGIASAVRYAIANWGVDASRVFVTGLSSGAMMTNVLLGAYPELFKAGSAWAGVPFGCFASTGTWNSQCSSGQSIKSAAEWGNLVRAAYPGYTGPRPKMQLWHGTNDETLNYQNFLEEIKQWTNVLGVSLTSTSSNTPISGYTKTVYGTGQVEAYSAAGVTHSIPIRAEDTLKFFGL